jgi:KaiC/GvpD/RAD55 family RecA-like ATPase/class 3 adenylate cyclase
MGSSNNGPGRRPQIPGIADLIDNQEAMPPSVLLLLAGPAGVGKTMYCRQFLVDGLLGGDYCVYTSPSLDVQQFKDLFSGIDNDAVQNLTFINPYHASAKKGAEKLSVTLTEISRIIAKAKKRKDGGSSSSHSLRVVVDSLTHLSLLFGEKATTTFVAELSLLLKKAGAKAILTLNASEQHLGALGSLADGILEMKLEEGSDGALGRSIRLLSIKGMRHRPRWVSFRIADDGSLVFGDQSAAAAAAAMADLTCTLCGKTIIFTPIMDSDLAFDTKICMETYRKLAGVYGSSIAETGLTTQVFNVNFFFIDIVGLSDPSLSVKKQMQKIEVLNRLIASCDAFKGSKEKKIILPTGDGMAIGFLLNQELPLELSIQLHRKLHVHNRAKPAEDAIGVRIGLGSGPVFIVSDINNNQNVWGPGIVLARRVMDAGDSGHILLSSRLAEELTALKDEYRSIIKPISDVYEIKHGQKIGLYSAYSHDFGNPEMPTKVPQARQQ